MATREMREEILARVRRGETSTETAEHWAAENGEIFSTKPDPARFDPMTEPHWTLPMAAAWIIERSGEKVREQWDIYRSEWLDWESLGPRILAPNCARLGRPTWMSSDDVLTRSRTICWASHAKCVLR